MPEKNNIRTIIVTSVLTTVVVILLVLGVVRANREKIAVYFLGGSSANTSPIQTLPGESAVVSAVKKTNPAVVSIVITKNVPVAERYFGFPF
jgi:hypothetical protein